VTQPGRVIVRFHVIDSSTGTPRLSLAVQVLSERVQSPESQMTRPEDITCTCSVPGPRSKVQGSAAVDTA